MIGRRAMLVVSAFRPRLWYPALMTAAAWGGGVRVVGAQEGPVLTERELSPDLRLIQGHPNGNVLVWITTAGAVVVDAQAPELADTLADLLSSVPVPVTYVVSTHYHEDHLGANGLLRRQGATLIGHENLARQARKDTTIALLGWERRAAPEEVLPMVTVSGDTVLSLAGHEIRLLSVPAAHTDGDLMVWIPGLNVIHTGDVVEMDAYPFIDFAAGGTVGGLIAAVDRVLALADERTMIVPGHGHVATRGDVASYREMLRVVRDRVRGALDAGRSLEETMGAGLTAEYDAGRGGASAGRRFVGIVYVAMEGRP